MMAALVIPTLAAAPASAAGPLTQFVFNPNPIPGTTTVTIPNLTLRNSRGAVLTTVSPQVGVTIK